MKITLIQCPWWGIHAPPLALASLSAFLRNKGLSVAVMDLNIDMFYRCKEEYKRLWSEAEQKFWSNKSLVEKFYLDNQELMDEYLGKIISGNPKIVGFSIYNTSLYLSLILAKKIKELVPKTVIVFGGPHCSRFMGKDYIISHGAMDVLVEGEGEETLFCIISALIKGRGLEGLPGAIIKKGNQIIDGGERPLIDNLDRLPFPDFSDFPVGKYQKNDALPVSTSRGCINRCVFCYEWLLWKKYRYKTGQYVFEEIKYQLARHPNIKSIEFYDSLLNGNLKELEILCNLLIKERIKIRWTGQASIRVEMDAGLFSKMKKSGCWCIRYGFESGSQHVLDTVRKRFRIADAERIVRRTYKAGIDVVLNFMFGLPGETEDDFQSTLEFISRNRRYITIVSPSPVFCFIVRGTYIDDHPEEFDISCPVDNRLFWKTNDDSNNYLIRLKRFERFCEFAHSIGVKAVYPVAELPDRNKAIGDYYLYNRNYSEALMHYHISSKKEVINPEVKRRMDYCQMQLTKNS